MYRKYVVDSLFNNKTIYHVLKQKFELSERLIKKLKSESKFLLNGSIIRTVDYVCTGDIMEFSIDFEEEIDHIPVENISLDILYEDELIIAINKEPGYVVHPTSLHKSGTMANGLAYYYQQQNLKIKIRPVSRLDKDTSGVIVFAKNAYVQDFLIKQMKKNVFLKEYIGIVNGIVEQDFGSIIKPIARKPGSIMLRQIDESGDYSVTHYKVEERYKNATLLNFKLETGRTHQIRVHCQSIDHPLIGDTLYSELVTNLIQRQALHSRRVGFIHPNTMRNLFIDAPIPEDITKAIYNLE